MARRWESCAPHRRRLSAKRDQGTQADAKKPKLFHQVFSRAVLPSVLLAGAYLDSVDYMHQRESVSPEKAAPWPFNRVIATVENLVSHSR